MHSVSIAEVVSEWRDELLFSISESLSFCLAIFNCDGEMLFANDAMKLLITGEPKECLLNPSFEKLLSLDNENWPIFNGYLTIGKSDKISTSIITQVFRKDDKFLIVGGVDAKNLIDQNEATLFLNRQVNDLQRQLIREKHELELTLKKLNELNEELNLLNATKDKFFSIIAHDLRNPFGSVLAISSLLAMKARVYPLEKVESFAKNLNLASQQAFDLLENLLEWSRIQTGKLRPYPIVFLPSEVINQALALCEHTAKQKNIDLSTEEITDISVFADREMVSTVVRNLIANALKFTEHNGKISISTSIQNSMMVFSVADTGVGIESSLLDKLFRIDAMLSAPGTDGEKGTGLGLILCKEFINCNSGEIWAESVVGKGSRFSFSIPLA